MSDMTFIKTGLKIPN